MRASPMQPDTISGRSTRASREIGPRFSSEPAEGPNIETRSLGAFSLMLLYKLLGSKQACFFFIFLVSLYAKLA